MANINCLLKKIIVLFLLLIVLLITSILITWTPSRSSFGSQHPPSNEFFHFVVTLDGVDGSSIENNGRLKLFKERFSKKCAHSDVDFTPCFGQLSSSRGVGVTLAFISCLKQALEYQPPIQAAFFYEDDAEVFVDKARKSSPLCSVVENKQILEAMSDDALLGLLGGHDFVISARADAAVKKEHSMKLGLTRIIHSWGAYGWVIKRENIENLVIWFELTAEKSLNDNSLCSPDAAWYELAAVTGKYVYAANPLLVDHFFEFSNTWVDNPEKMASREFQGKLDINLMLTDKNRTDWKRKVFNEILGYEW